MARWGIGRSKAEKAVDAHTVEQDEDMIKEFAGYHAERLKHDACVRCGQPSGHARGCLTRP